MARQFASVAQAYERGRPEYAPAVIGATAAELGIAPGDRVLDLAAGTGKLTRALVAYGFGVVAVEPQEPLRAVLTDKVGAARVLDGVAEQIPLEDGSVAAVMIANAFHWFDRPRALSAVGQHRRTALPSTTSASGAEEKLAVYLAGVARLVRSGGEISHDDG